jgi:peptide/nickel transport system ATP-binding protein
MIAMALACGPALLIADEPTTALDVTIQEEILSLMRELRKELSMALLLITHNLAVIYRNAEDTAVMYAGKIVETAPTAALFRNPMHPYTIKLLRSTPDMEKRGKPLEAIPGVAPSPAEYPAGCRFSGRCHREMTGCAAAEPPLAEREPGHFVSCHLYDGEFMGSALSAPLMREEAVFPLHMKGAGEPLLEVKGLKVYYPIKKGILKRTIGYTKAVDGINITVRKGSTVALVGESGCGKTTAGKAIIRLIDPLEGEIAFEGKDIARLTGRELKRYRPLMQIIFQDPYSSLNPRLTAGEIIEEGLKSLKTGMTKNERAKKIASTLALVGLAPEMTARYPHEFSGGQRQRVAIARALAVEPLFIICDEATSALDVSIQAQILNLLKSIQKDLGISLLFITHDLSVVEYMADEVFVMYNGRIVERGTMDEIFLSPGDAYTRRLIDAAPRIDKG